MHNMSTASKEMIETVLQGSNINTQSSQNRDEIFDRLAKTGTKQQKLQDYEKIKEIYELSECTFKPQIKGKIKSEDSVEPPVDRGN